MNKTDLLYGIFCGLGFAWFSSPGMIQGALSPWIIGFSLLPYAALFSALLFVPALVRGEQALLITILTFIIASAVLSGIDVAAFQVVVALAPTVVVAYWLARLSSLTHDLSLSVWTGALALLIALASAVALADAMIVFNLASPSGAPGFIEQVINDGRTLVGEVIRTVDIASQQAGAAGQSAWGGFSQPQGAQDYFLIVTSGASIPISYVQVYSSVPIVVFIMMMLSVRAAVLVSGKLAPARKITLPFSLMIIPGRYIVPVLFVVTFLLGRHSGAFGLFALLCNAGLSILYMFNGLMFLHFLAKDHPAKSAILGAIYAVLLLALVFFPLISLLLLILGLAEHILHYKARKLAA